MRILQVCPKSPFPPSEGGPMAMKAIRDGLVQAGHQVHTFTLSTPKFTVDASMAAQINNFSHSFLDTSVYIWPAFRDLMLNRSHHVTRFYNSRIAMQLQKLLQDKTFDIVFIESIFMMPYFGIIRKNFNGPVVLRAHNLEHVIWERISSNGGNLLKKGYLKILARQLKRFELGCFMQADAIAAISDVDAEAIKKMVPEKDVVNIPFAIEPATSIRPPKKFSGFFGHIGSMDWAPNAEGIDWFLKNVWASVRLKSPEVLLHLAGRNMPIRFQTSEKEGIVVEGEVESAKTFMNSLDVLVVPLFSGSGVRIKIAEAMSLGIPVITTPVGAEGLQVEKGRDLFLCENAKEMSDCILNIISKPDILDAISVNSLATIRLHHSPEVVTKKLVELFHRKLIS